LADNACSAPFPDTKVEPAPALKTVQAWRPPEEDLVSCDESEYSVPPSPYNAGVHPGWGGGSSSKRPAGSVLEGSSPKCPRTDQS